MGFPTILKKNPGRKKQQNLQVCKLLKVFLEFTCGFPGDMWSLGDQGVCVCGGGDFLFLLSVWGVGR